MNKQQRMLAAILVLIVSLARAQTVEYIHTDALGSPVAVTNASGVVIERTVYEPYGQVINRPVTNGPGYTGHVMDAVTGLNYMQQRYYDPQLGRFLSNDPVTATSVGGNFNRYWYANNNPYRFTDPDGRNPAAIGEAIVIVGGVLIIGCEVDPNCNNQQLGQAVLDTLSEIAEALGNLLSSESSEEQATAPEPGTAESDEGCIYCVKGENTRSGKDYIGSADDLEKRARDQSDGRDRRGADKVDKYKKGDRTDRQNKEQKAMNDRGGKDKLDNKRNEVAPKKWEERNIEPPKD